MKPIEVVEKIIKALNEEYLTPEEIAEKIGVKSDIVKKIIDKFSKGDLKLWFKMIDGKYCLHDISFGLIKDRIEEELEELDLGDIGVEIQVKSNIEDVELIFDGDKPVVNPALDFKNGKIYLTQTLPVRVNDKTIDMPVVITYDGKNKECITIDKRVASSMSTDTFRMRTLPMAVPNRWSLKKIKQFLEDNYNPSDYTLEKVFGEVRKQFDTYMQFTDERHYDFVAIWTIGTYFYPIFEAYPMLFFNALKGSGKTKVLTLIGSMAFNSLNALNVTSSSLFRMIEGTKATILIDEIEHITKKETSDLRALLLGGYKKGQFVPRTEEMKKKGVKTYGVPLYDIYSPKALANISGIEDILEDRCISIILEKGTDPEKVNREVDVNDEKWQKIRDKLFMCLMVNAKAVYEESKRFSINDIKSVVSEVSEHIVPKEQVSTGNEGEGSVVFSEGETDIQEQSPQEICEASVVSGEKRNFSTFLPEGNVGENTTQTTETAQVEVKNNNLTTQTALNTQENIDKTYTLTTQTTPISTYSNQTTPKKEGKYQFYKKTTLITHEIYTDKEKLELATELLTRGRSFELWKPILVLSKLINDEVFFRIVTLALEHEYQRYEENVAEVLENVLITALSSIVKEDDYYRVSEITSKLKELEPETEKWVNSKWVGRALKRMGLIMEKKRHSSGVMVRLSPEKIKEYAERHNILLVPEKEDENKPVEDKQTRIKRILEEMDKEFKGAIPEKEFIKRLEESGISNGEAVVQKLLTEGHVFHVMPGHLKKV